MADAAYDVIIVGGGNKALCTAVYLAKYGGMKVAIFDRRHELGGALAAQEGAAPAFLGDTHVSVVAMGRWYWAPVFEDFPDFEEKGAKLGHYLCSSGIITKEDHHCLGIYHELEDTSGERTLKAVAKFAGEKDADTYYKIMELNKEGGALWQARRQQLFNPPPPPGEETPTARWFRDYLKDPACLADESWRVKRLYQAANELWESKGMVYLQLRSMKSAGGQSGHMCGGLAISLLNRQYLRRDMMFVIGGMHNIAHAYIKIFLQNGGKFFTNCHVDKILVENGRAKGIRLQDGTQVEAKQMVVTGIDPHQLIFNLLGKEYVSAKIQKKVACLIRREHMINWVTFAVHEMPKYKAAEFQPDIGNTQRLDLGSYDTDELVEEDYWRLLNKHHPSASFSIFCSHSLYDKTQAPEGKHVFGVEEEEIPAFVLTERQWMQRNKDFADKCVKVIHEYAPNMTWDNVIGYYPNSPYAVASRHINTGPAGHLSIIDTLPGQMYPWRPIPELAQYKVPWIGGLYCTGSAWGHGAGGQCAEGYNCYKVIAKDLGLRKPWEEKGRPW